MTEIVETAQQNMLKINFVYSNMFKSGKWKWEKRISNNETRVKYKKGTGLSMNLTN